MTKIDLYLSILIIFIVGFVLVSWTQYSHAGGRHTPPQVTNINNSYSISDSTCAVAGASGLHWYKQSDKWQGSVSAANCDHANAVSFGIGRQDGDFVYSFTGSVDDVRDEHIFIGAQFGWTID